MTDYCVSFPRREWARLVAAGTARQKNHKDTDRGSQRTKEDLNAEHICGYVGEEAFGYIANLEVDTALRQGGDGLIDFRVGKLTVDVKARSRSNYAMLIKADQLLVDHHAYVHCWVDGGTVRFWGWMPGNEVSNFPRKPARNRSLPYENYEIEPHESARRDLRDLLDLIEKCR